MPSGRCCTRARSSSSSAMRRRNFSRACVRSAPRAPAFRASRTPIECWPTPPAGASSPCRASFPRRPSSITWPHRRFPVTVWIRRRDELDYLVEPDVFHDFFGHVPLLTIPAFARFMQAYGAGGPQGACHTGCAARCCPACTGTWSNSDSWRHRRGCASTALASSRPRAKPFTASRVRSRIDWRFELAAGHAHRISHRRVSAELLRHR